MSIGPSEFGGDGEIIEGTAAEELAAHYRLAEETAYDFERRTAPTPPEGE